MILPSCVTISRSRDALPSPFAGSSATSSYLGEFRLDGAIAKAHRAGFQLHRQFAGPVAAFGRGGLRQEGRKIAFAPDNLLNAEHRRAVPVTIEDLGRFCHYATDAQHVEIEEIVFVADLEILVAMLRADDRVTAPSTIDLLCMRRFMRIKSKA